MISALKENIDKIKMKKTIEEIKGNIEVSVRNPEREKNILNIHKQQ